MDNMAKGTEIAGKFVMSDRLGRGANGEVWKATDKEARRDVAIKVLINADGNDETSRLLHEAQKWGGLEHENILRLYEVRTSEKMLVMECAEGGSLETMIRANALKHRSVVSVAPPCSPAEATKLFTDVLRGLSHAHEKGIVHGDMKPGNILLSRIGTAKISDFGMARQEINGVFSLSPGMRSTGMSGTPEFMSPEQARGDQIDRQSDVFSAGIVGFLLFTGRHPYNHPSLVLQPREAIADEDIAAPDAREFVQEVPEKIAKVLSRMLLKDRSKRYESVRDILADIDDDSATVVCNDCGSYNPVGNRFCGQCGQPLTGTAPDEKPVSTVITRAEVSADDLVDEGFDMARKGDWEGAIRRYREALRSDPRNQKAHSNLGYALNRLGLYEDAIGILTEGIECDPHPAQYSYRGYSYRNLRKYEQALLDFDAALKERPHDAFALKEKAYCLEAMGEPEKAYFTVLKALQHDQLNYGLLALRQRLEDSSPEIRQLLRR